MSDRTKTLTTTIVIVACLLFAPLAVEAQPVGKVHRIGFLTAVSPVKAFKLRLTALRKGLRELGYVEGQNIVIEERYAKGRREKLPELAAELVRLNLDVMRFLVTPQCYFYLRFLHRFLKLTESGHDLIVDSENHVAISQLGSCRRTGDYTANSQRSPIAWIVLLEFREPLLVKAEFARCE